MIAMRNFVLKKKKKEVKFQILFSNSDKGTNLCTKCTHEDEDKT